MQRELMERIRALMDEGVGTRVLGWRKGESFYFKNLRKLLKPQIMIVVHMCCRGKLYTRDAVMQQIVL